MPQDPVDNPYRLIQEFWGESLSPQLASRIIGAPEKHLHAFRDVVFDAAYFEPLPVRAPGTLRPVLTPHAQDNIASYSGRAHERAASLLVFAHEVVVESPLRAALMSPSRDDLTQCLRWLQGLETLDELGCLHFRPVRSMKLHPSASPVPEDGLNDLTALGELIPSVGEFLANEREVAAKLGLPESEWVQHASRVLALDVVSHDRMSRTWSSTADELYQSQAEWDLQRYLRSQSVSFVDREMLALALWNVPLLEGDVATLARIRTNEDSFYSWRSALGGVLAAADVDQDLSDLQAELDDRMAVVAESMTRAVKASPSLSALRSGIEKFGVSVTAAGASYLAGATLMAAVAGGLAGATAESIRHYIRAKTDNRRLADEASLAVAFIRPR